MGIGSIHMLVETILNALSKLEALRDISLKELMKDEKLQGFILWNLYISVQGCIDLAFKTIARLNLENPKTYKEAFEILYKNNLISKDVKNSLQDAAKFRNALAHLYIGINLAVVKKVISENLTDLRRYISELDVALQKKGIDIYDL